MSEVQHTPGPWHYGEDNAGRLEVSTEKRSIAKINVAFMDGGEAEANACLIAAAPELLGLANRAEMFISGFEDDEEQEGVASLLADLRTAIAKATGVRA